jgi:hypothetical protein
MLCRRLKAPLLSQKMGGLVEGQVTPGLPPFSHVGIDVFGHMFVKVRRSREKRWGVIFTCLASRAVHIEIVHSLDTDSFLGAFSRFVARRGTPVKVHSDRGTNFVSGEKELREGVEGWNIEKIQSRLVNQGVEWEYNPPAASHRGGAWERLIRSTKAILRVLARRQLLHDEALLTLIAEAERVMNDRPLVHVSSDSRDPDALTPSRLLLLGRSNSTAPSTHRGPGLLRWWRQAHQLANMFWKRWVREYIPTLIQQQKWHRERSNLAVNDIVLVRDKTTPRGQWPMGRVEEVKEGRDGLVRSARVRLAATGRSLVRPITQLCLLEAAKSEL